MSDLTLNERKQIEEILRRRANEIAGFRDDLRGKQDIASVDFALELEVKRLRRLADKVNPQIELEDDA